MPTYLERDMTYTKPFGVKDLSCFGDIFASWVNLLGLDVLWLLGRVGSFSVVYSGQAIRT